MEPSISDEMKRTTVLKTVVLPVSPREVIALGRRFFTEHGYRALPASTPNNLMVRGSREGGLPSVIGEIEVREKQSVKGRTSVVSLSAYGERLGQTMLGFYDVLRAERQRARAAPVAASQHDGAPEDEDEDEPDAPAR